MPASDIAFGDLLGGGTREVLVPVVEVTHTWVGLARLVAGRALELADRVGEPHEPAVPTRRLVLEDDVVRERLGLLERDLPLNPNGTKFQLEVLSELKKIPYGTTTSYGDIAERIGRPKAVRAVGAANGRNPIPIIIPCHRVIGSSGDLTGFGGGLPTKEALLRLEMEHSQFPHVNEVPAA